MIKDNGHYNFQEVGKCLFNVKIIVIPPSFLNFLYLHLYCFHKEEKIIPEYVYSVLTFLK